MTVFILSTVIHCVVLDRKLTLVNMADSLIYNKTNISTEYPDSYDHQQIVLFVSTSQQQSKISSDIMTST